MKKILIIIAGFMVTSFFSTTEAGYSDHDKIPSWAEQSIEVVQEKGIMTGFGDGTFQPKRNLNRAEALVLIFRTKGIDPSEVSNNVESKFTDVPRGAWFEKAVLYATEKDWIKGFPDGGFHPEKELNKAEFAVLLQRVYELESDEEEVPRFSDIPEKVWFKDAVLALYNNDLIRHGRAYKFFPDKKISRDEAAWVFAQILGKPRLMGTSKSNDFESSSGGRLSSRRTAIRRSDLNINKQGYDIEKDAIYVNAFDRIDLAQLQIGSDWVEIGNVILENKLNDRTTLDSISFRIRFDQSVGPARNFIIKMVNDKNETEEIEFGRDSTAVIHDWGKEVKSGESYKFKAFVKPMDSTGYYPKKGTGSIYIGTLQATAVADFVGINSNSGRVNYKKAPIVYNSRNFTDIEFNPVVE